MELAGGSAVSGNRSELEHSGGTLSNVLVSAISRKLDVLDQARVLLGLDSHCIDIPSIVS